MKRVHLPNVTLVITDTVNYGVAIYALKQTLLHIIPARVIFFTDIDLPLPDGVELIRIKSIFTVKDYSKWMIKELGKQNITTSHILVIQADGYVLKGDIWDDQFLNYDFIGAPWLEVDGHNVGNGGFSLRSFKLHQAIAEDDHILPLQPEDTALCRIYRNYLEQKYGFKWAPEELAHKFSFELHKPRQFTFGFHQDFHKPFKPYIVIKRYAAMGDVIQVEPILKYWHNQGYNVVLDSKLFFHFFQQHYFPVTNYEYFDKSIPHRTINLDMAYEVSPKQLHLKSYFEKCGITDYTLENPRLNWTDNPKNRIFKKYVVIHIDKRATTHRNQYGVDWKKVRSFLESHGYTVIQMGLNEHEDAGIHFNTLNPMMMLWLIGGCDLFIGADSGPSHIAVALGKKCALFFGSVNPEYIHADMTNIIAIPGQKCPISEDYCWHDQVSVEGRPCPVDVQMPPCCTYDTQVVMGIIATNLSI